MFIFKPKDIIGHNVHLPGFDIFLIKSQDHLYLLCKQHKSIGLTENPYKANMYKHLINHDIEGKNCRYAAFFRAFSLQLL